MGRTLTVMTILALAGFTASVAMTSERSVTPVPDSKPIQRGYGQHDACFGDKYERDEDLKTGNELSVERILELLTQPGT